MGRRSNVARSLRVNVVTLALVAVAGILVGACRETLLVSPPQLTPRGNTIVCPSGWSGSGDSAVCDGGVVVCADDGSASLGALCNSPSITDFDLCYPFGGGGGGGNDAPCGDERDQIIQEYKSYGVAQIPSCATFTQSASNAYYSYGQLSANNTYSWSILRFPLTVSSSTGYGLEKWVVNIGAAYPLNSVYRSPAHNIAVGGAANSRHVYGDAVDMRNQSGSYADWSYLIVAAQAAGADYTEPTSLPCHTNCAHADWRVHF